MRLNPYTPGAGMFPTYLAGRDALLDEAEENLMRLQRNYPQQSMIFYGLRGVGKTVLLNAIREKADQMDALTELMESSEDGNFKERISLCAQKFILRMSPLARAQSLAAKALSILKVFKFAYETSDGSSMTVELDPDSELFKGIAGTGDFQNDLTELFIAMGVLAKDTENSICIFIDEIQYLKPDELGALLTAIHQANQKRLPIMVFGAGLPQVTKILGQIRSYAERLFIYRKIDSLSDADAKLALTEPARLEGVSYTDEALNEILKITGNYPYFIQEFATQTWDYIEANTINLTAVSAAVSKFESTLDSGFFKVRFDKASNKQKLFMFAMLDCDGLPCTISQVAANMHTEVQRISPLRGQLISKGFIYPSQYGQIDFTVPHFDKFLKRNINLKPV